MWIVMVGPVKDPDTTYLGFHLCVYLPKIVLSHELGKFTVPNCQRIEPLAEGSKPGGKVAINSGRKSGGEGIAGEEADEEVEEEAVDVII
ncbi:hypothetical protein Ddye_022993 [Dipteronia dyeriana]|uniref:Uncharacterized protein n=1 Tax=Dipteronia dyeriana TaxID=168575 RepID=A0AAD9TT32_9ROSI|nr:hypothetical protein Ddye_022993 [Dipteronia dyeriana]